MVLFAVLPADAAPYSYQTDQRPVGFRAGQVGEDPGLPALGNAPPGPLRPSGQDSDSRGWPQREIQVWAANHVLAENTISKQHRIRAQLQREKLAAENERLRRDQMATREALAHLQTRLNTAKALHQQLISTIVRLRSLIPRRQALEEQHRTLLSQVVALESDVELLRVENDARRNEASHDWVMLAISVLLGGVLVGLLVIRIRW